MMTVQDALAGREFAQEIDNRPGFLLMDALVILRYEDDENSGAVVIATEGTDLIAQSGMVAHLSAAVSRDVRRAVRGDS